MLSTNERKIIVNNIKASFKIDTPVEFEFVKSRCVQLPKLLGIECYQRQANILTIRFNQRTFILFKRSANLTQHCNITRCLSEEDIQKGIQDFLFLINQPPKIIEFIIDNYSCSADLECQIPLESIYLEEPSGYYRFNPERFPALEIRCPDFIGSETKGNLCCLLYRSGKCVIVGGRDLCEIGQFYEWIKFMINGKYVKLL